MRKIGLVALLTFYIFLSGCSINFGSSEEKIFEKKKECVSLKNEMHEQFMTNIKYLGWDESGDLYITDSFYNKEENSCLYIANYRVSMVNRFSINDYFSNKMLHEKVCDAIDEEELNSCSKRFYNEIEQFK